MNEPIFIVDAFAEKPFSGNPAAVCLLEECRDENWMQSLAAEMNLSETAFLARRDGGFDLRWFTPGGEVGLCGHATLASAHVVWEAGWAPAGELLRFHTRSGELLARPRGEGRRGGRRPGLLRRSGPDLLPPSPPGALPRPCRAWPLPDGTESAPRG